MSLLNSQMFIYHNLFFNLSTTNLLYETNNKGLVFFRIDKRLVLNHPLVLKQKQQPAYSFFRYKCMLKDFFSLVHVDVPVCLRKKLQNEKNFIGNNAKWFTNLLMTRGLKIKTLKTIVKSFLISFETLGFTKFRSYVPKN